MILAAFYHTILATLFAFLAILLMGVILLQRGRGVGLAGAFGGAGGHTAFGAKTGDVLTWTTIVLAGVLLLYVVVLNYVFVPPPADLGAPPPIQLPAEPAGSAGDEGVPVSATPVSPGQTPPAPAPGSAQPPADSGTQSGTTPPAQSPPESPPATQPSGSGG